MKMRSPFTSRQSPEAAFVTLAVRGERPAANGCLAAAASAVRDWDKVAFHCVQHRMSGWVLQSIAASGLSEAVPAKTLGVIRNNAMRAAFQGLMLSGELVRVQKALSAHDVPSVLLKGPAIANRFYPDPALRPYGDIDLLLPIETHSRAMEVCADLGYRVAEDHGGLEAANHGTCEWPYETAFTHSETHISLDVHYDHFQIGVKPRFLSDVWQRAEAWTLEGHETRVLALNDLFLFLCVHLSRHGFGGLFWFKDIDLILRLRGPDLDWPWLLETAEREGVSSSLGYTLRLLTMLLGTQLPPEAERLAAASGRSVVHRLLWRESEVMELRVGRWRRAVQFVPWDGPRGALPSLLVMGRRTEKLGALLHRATRFGRRAQNGAGAVPAASATAGKRTGAGADE